MIAPLHEIARGHWVDVRFVRSIQAHRGGPDADGEIEDASLCVLMDWGHGKTEFETAYYGRHFTSYDEATRCATRLAEAVNLYRATADEEPVEVRDEEER